jgi:hypothetical protein
LDLKNIHQELQKRLRYPYHWGGRMQFDAWDAQTKFIYYTASFDELYQKSIGFDPDLKNYALNRWYNFWSAKAVEHFFCLHQRVKPNENPYDKTVDFFIDNIPFDHKTSVFPKGFNKKIIEAKSIENDLITWLYKNQSQQGRKHYKNRIFILLYDHNSQDHWKLKANLPAIATAINKFLTTKTHWQQITIEGHSLQSKIIWVEKYKL